MPAATMLSAPAAPAAQAVRSRTHVVAQLLSLSPLPVLAAVALGPSDVRRVLLQPGPELLGLPSLVFLAAVVGVWTLAGLLVMRRARSPVGQTVTLLVFTIPATVAAVVWPLVLVGGPVAS